MEVTAKVLLDDVQPWFTKDVQPNNDSAFLRYVHDEYPVVIETEQARLLSRAFAHQCLLPGDLCLVPLMSAALLIDPAQSVEGVTVLPMPLSRHPFWCLMPPGDSLGRLLERYEDLSDCFLSLLEAALVSGKYRRVVFLDSNSATGRDFTMISGLVRAMSKGKMKCWFYVLCNETITGDLHVGPGLRGGKKSASPNNWAVRVNDHNVKYMTHLYALLAYSDAERELLAAQLISQHPRLFCFWNDYRVRLHSVHGYQMLGGEHEAKARVRFSASEQSMTATLALRQAAINFRSMWQISTTFCERVLVNDPLHYWMSKIGHF